MSNIIAKSSITGKEIICEYNVPESKVTEQLKYWRVMGMSFCEYYAKSIRTFTKKGIS